MTNITTDTTTFDDTDGHREPGHTASPTAAACDAARLFGATPAPDEHDNRPVWDEHGAIAGAEQAFHALAQDIAPDGTQLADEREALLWGFVNTFHAQVLRLDRAVDRIAPEMRELQRAQDGTEVKAWQLERLTERARNVGDRRDAFEKLRDFAADAYKAETGQQWRPRHGSHTSHTGKLTSAAIDARDFIRARKDRETRAHLPDGTLVAVAGGREAEDADAIWAALDRVKTRHTDMVLLHGGGPGAERIAASWAERNCVHQIVCKPDWDRHGRAAPFRRNDDLLNLLPKGLVAFPAVPASPRTSSTRRASSASPYTASQPERHPHHLGRSPHGDRPFFLASPRRSERRRRPRGPPSRPHRTAPLAHPGPQSPFSAPCATPSAWKPSPNPHRTQHAARY